MHTSGLGLAAEGFNSMAKQRPAPSAALLCLACTAARIAVKGARSDLEGQRVLGQRAAEVDLSGDVVPLEAGREGDQQRGAAALLRRRGLLRLPRAPGMALHARGAVVASCSQPPGLAYFCMTLLLLHIRQLQQQTSA